MTRTFPLWALFVAIAVACGAAARRRGIAAPRVLAAWASSSVLLWACAALLGYAFAELVGPFLLIAIGESWISSSLADSSPCSRIRPRSVGFW